MIVTKVKSIVHSKYVLAECKVKNDNNRWDRTLLVDWGEDGYNSDGDSRRRFKRDDVVVYDNSMIIPQPDITHGLTYLLDLFDNNVPPNLKEMKIFHYFQATKMHRAIDFMNRAEVTKEKNNCLRGWC
jgi:hypothetical protein